MFPAGSSPEVCWSEPFVYHYDPPPSCQSLPSQTSSCFLGWNRMRLLGLNGAEREKRVEYEDNIDNLCSSHHLGNVPRLSMYIDLFIIAAIFFISNLIVFPPVAVPGTFLHINHLSWQTALSRQKAKNTNFLFLLMILITTSVDFLLELSLVSVWWCKVLERVCGVGGVCRQA